MIFILSGYHADRMMRLSFLTDIFNGQLVAGSYSLSSTQDSNGYHPTDTIASKPFESL